MTLKTLKNKPEKQSTYSKQSVSKTSKHSGKKSEVSSTNLTPQVKSKATKKSSSPKVSSKADIYRLNTWEWRYEDVTKPEPSVEILEIKSKHAWKVLRG